MEFPTKQTEQMSAEFNLTPDDQSWLTSFDVEPSWQDNPEDITKLHEIVTVGSIRLYPDQTVVSHSAILKAREEFLQFMRLSEETIDRFRLFRLYATPFMLHIRSANRICIR